MPLASFLQPLQDLNVSVARAAAAAPTGGAGHSSGPLAGFAMQVQQQTEWCWAAVSASVANFFGSLTWTQCKVAAGELGLNCCGSDGPQGCNQPWTLHQPLSRVGHFNRMSSASTSFIDSQNEINAGRPLCCRIAWARGNAHFVALGGCSTAPDGTEYVDSYDPFYGLVQKTYADFVSAYLTVGDSWTHSYFTIKSGATGGATPSVNFPKSE